MRALVSWSSGKDSALALYAVKPRYEIVGLLAIVDISHSPPLVTGHRIPLSLVEMQAENAGIPLYTVELPSDLPPTHVYERAVLEALDSLRRELEVEYVVYGDIFLRDVMEYKRRLLERVGLKPLYPLEGIDTITLTELTLNLGFKAIVVAVDPRRIPGDLVCSEFDRTFLKRLPATVDPAGERGEFHTFVYQAPFYRSPVNIEIKGVTIITNSSTGLEKRVCIIH